MEPHFRIILTRQNGHPERSTLVQTDRAVGEIYLKDFPVEWAGMIAVEDEFRLGVQWLLEQSRFEEVMDYFETHGLDDFKIRVFKVDDEELEEILISEF